MVSSLSSLKIDQYGCLLVLLQDFSVGAAVQWTGEDSVVVVLLYLSHFRIELILLLKCSLKPHILDFFNHHHHHILGSLDTESSSCWPLLPQKL